MDAAALSLAKTDARRKAIAANPSNIATRMVAHRMATLNAATAKTFQFTMECVDHFDAVRLIFASDSASYSPTITAFAATAPTSAADVNNSSGSWVSGTKQGQTGFTVPLAPMGTDLTTHVVSGWINLPSVARTDGGTYPLLTVRAYMVANATLPVVGNGTDDFTNWATRSDGGRRFWWRHQDGEQVTTPSGFTSTTNQSQSPIIGVQYLTRGQVITVGAVGDSITEGRGTYLGEGFVLPALEELNAAGGPTKFEYACLGWSGQPYDRITERGIAAIRSDVKPDILVIPVGTPNPTADGALTDAAVSAIRTRRARIVAACQANDVTPVLWTWLPTNTSVRDYAGTDAKRVALNNEALSQALRNFLVADTAAAVAGATVSGQVQFNATYTTDGVHPNNAGNAVMADVVKPKLAEAARRSHSGRKRTESSPSDRPVFYISDQFTSGSPLPLAHAGVYVYNRGASASFFNLPPLDPATSPDSQVYEIRCRPTSGAVQVNRSGADAIAVAGSPRASLTVKPGQSVKFVPGPDGVWDVLGLDSSRHSAITVSSATTLTLDLTAEVYVFTGASTATWSLPALPVSGLTYKVKNRGSATVNLFRGGTGSTVYTTSAVDFVAIAAGGTAEVVWDGSFWCVFT